MIFNYNINYLVLIVLDIFVKFLLKVKLYYDTKYKVVS